MSKLRLIFLLATFLSLFNFLSVNAQENNEISVGKKHWIKSEILGEEREIWVYTPPSHADQELVETYPVVYLLDGDWYFQVASAFVQYSKGSFKLPEMIVVGVLNTDRIRDMTPTNATVNMFGDTIQGLENSGGGSSFLQFFEQELFPFVEQNYRAMPYRILVGHSFGGLWAAQALLQEKQQFNAMLLIDPSLWWNNKELLRDLTTPLTRALDQGTTVYFAEADNAATETTANGPHVEAMHRFSEVLKTLDQADRRMQHAYFSGETHASVGIPALYAGLSFLFNGYRPSDEVFNNADLIQAHFEALSKAWNGYFLPPEGLVRNLGWGAQYGRGDLTAAIEFFELNTLNYPNSSNAFKVLGEALMANESSAAAAEAFERALLLKPDDQDLLQKLTQARGED